PFPTAGKGFAPFLKIPASHPKLHRNCGRAHLVPALTAPPRIRSPFWPKAACSRGHGSVHALRPTTCTSLHRSPGSSWCACSSSTCRAPCASSATLVRETVRHNRRIHTSTCSNRSNRCLRPPLPTHCRSSARHTPATDQPESPSHVPTHRPDRFGVHVEA